MMNNKPRRLFLAFILHPSSFILFFLSPACLLAQVVRLPAVAPSSPSPPGQLVSHPDSTAQILQAPGELDVAPATPPPGEPTLPPGVRNGVFQKILFDTAWLAPGGSDGLGSTDVQLQAIFALPCPTRDAPLVITPGFAVHYLQGPQDVELPPQLHEGYVDFRWMSQVTPSWGFDLAVTPSIFSDFEQQSSKAFRLPAHAAAAWTWTKEAKIVLGAAYLDMPGTNFIPVGGVIWTPNDDVIFDLVFPHPKISRRIYWTGQSGDDVQDWVYVAGEFDNDAWAIRRSDGGTEQVMLRDYRLVFGIQHKVIGGLSSHFDVGYVFGRRISYTSDTPDFYPTDTVMVRGGLTY
jgi:hypothetical protein